ncbi:MAG: M15 family metallopeptidase [Kangiellaceae bacterium]|nr:M15 family metallopeptidase [Kangiellaceae bacterium]
MKLLLLFSILLISLIPTTSFAEKSCTYTTYKWNTVQRKAVDFKTVQHPYSALQGREIDKQTGCTVCQEDQIEITITGLKPVKMCKILAEDLQHLLLEQVESYQNQIQTVNRNQAPLVPILKLVGYRVGMTKGTIDQQGNRTEFSNHSFGIALDINDEQNGLYDQCITFGSHCRLIKGGKWHPRQSGSITAESDIVHFMKQLGFKWGGEIKGKQKDFMHFSPTGY